LLTISYLKLRMLVGVNKKTNTRFDKLRYMLILAILILFFLMSLGNSKHTYGTDVLKYHKVFTMKTDYIEAVLENVPIKFKPSKVNFSQKKPYAVVNMAGVQDFNDEVVKRSVVIKKNKVQIYDSSLEKGQTRVVEQGNNGEKLQIVVLHKVNGSLKNETIVSEIKLTEAKDEIIAIGTKEPIRTVLTSKGNIVYKEVLTMVSTAYEASEVSCGKWADGYTAIGMKAEPGVVAVDPNVIPLRAKLYVEGYGFAIAADVGGAIKGKRIDLFFNTIEECINYGRKQVQVYIL